MLTLCKVPLMAALETCAHPCTYRASNAEDCCAGGTALRGVVDQLLRELQMAVSHGDGNDSGWQQAAAAAVTVLVEVGSATFNARGAWLPRTGLPGTCQASGSPLVTIVHAIRFIKGLVVLPALHAGAKACSMVSIWHPDVWQRLVVRWQSAISMHGASVYQFNHVIS